MSTRAPSASPLVPPEQVFPPVPPEKVLSPVPPEQVFPPVPSEQVLSPVLPEQLALPQPPIPDAMDRSAKAPRGGAIHDKVVATFLSCGLGGFHCATGGPSPQCHLRCCRADCDACAPLFFMCTCMLCCGRWGAYALKTHESRNVDFYKASFFVPGRNISTPPLPPVEEATTLRT